MSNSASFFSASTPGRRRLLVFLLLVIFLAAARAGLSYYLTSRLTAAEASYQGPSLQVADHLDRKAPVPNGWDSVEVTQLLLEGQAGLRPSVAGGTRMQDPEITDINVRLRLAEREGRRVNAEDLAQFRKTLDRLDGQLVHLLGALENAPEARYFGKTDGLPIEYEIPNLMGTMRLAGLLRARGEVALAEGRVVDAWQSARWLYRFAYWHASSMNTLIHTLIGRALVRQADAFSLVLLAENGGDPAAVAEAKSATLAEARRIDPLPLFEKALYAEQAAMFSTLKDTRPLPTSLYDISVSEKPFAARFVNWRPFRDYNAARYLEWSVASSKSCQEPAFRRRDAKIPVTPLPSWVAPAAVLTLDCDSYANHRDLLLASTHMREIAFALEEARQRTGRYPATLAEAGEQVVGRVDPFSGESYRYVLDGAGYRLYSLSVNGKDDGGETDFKADNNPNPFLGDWVFKVAPKALPEAAGNS